jgi:hypothetical protein
MAYRTGLGLVTPAARKVFRVVLVRREPGEHRAAVVLRGLLAREPKELPAARVPVERRGTMGPRARPEPVLKVRLVRRAQTELKGRAARKVRLVLELRVLRGVKEQTGHKADKAQLVLALRALRAVRG